MILAGDIGGTKTNLAVYAADTELNVPIIEECFHSQRYDSFLALLKDFFTNNAVQIQKACFGVAGPVINGRCSTSNISWVVDEKEIRETFNIPQVKILNDLESMGYGTLLLKDNDLKIINPGSPVEHGNIAVIAAGTGLGEAFLVWGNGRYRVIASEGGHTDFGPRNALEIELLKFLLNEFEHVSYERIVSGIGLKNIYQFLKHHQNYQEPAWLTERFAREDPNVVISESGLASRDPICEQTLQMFMSIYGAEAGNLALKVMSTGGIFIGGGIAPKILPAFNNGEFLNALFGKGRLSKVITKMPVKIILNEKTALLGAAHFAQSYF